MIMNIILLSLLFHNVISLCLDMSTCVIENKYLTNDLFHKTILPSLMDCAASCESRYGCFSFGFEPGPRACHLHTRDSSSAADDLVEKKKWIHGDIHSFPSELWGPCKDHNCNASQRCSVNRVTKRSYCRNVLSANVCQPPPVVSNTVISNGNQETGSFRNYTCVEGYLDITTLLTTAFVTCLPNNTWSPLSLNCTEPVTQNVALEKPATASSTYSNSPNSAVDGSSARRWGSASCFAVTHDDLNPWWQVDLQKEYAIFLVTIHTRDDCCPERLHDFDIEVSNYFDMTAPSVEKRLCFRYHGSVTAANVKVHCTTPLVGRYVRVTGRNKLNYNDILQFCEVEVHCID